MCVAESNCNAHFLIRFIAAGGQDMTEGAGFGAGHNNNTLTPAQQLQSTGALSYLPGLRQAAYAHLTK